MQLKNRISTLLPILLLAGILGACGPSGSTTSPIASATANTDTGTNTSATMTNNTTTIPTTTSTPANTTIPTTTSTPANTTIPTAASTPANTTSSSVIVSTGKVPTYQSVGSTQTILTTLQGMTLYIHEWQGASGFSCDGSCAQTWHPLLFNGTGTPACTTKIPGKLSVGTDAMGERVIYYQTYPLYTNVNDKAPGQYMGRGADNSPWQAAAIDIPTGL